jgi:hypothetical protein
MSAAPEVNIKLEPESLPEEGTTGPAGGTLPAGTRAPVPVLGEMQNGTECETSGRCLVDYGSSADD